MIAAALAATALVWMGLGIVAGLSLMPAGVLAAIATLGCASMVGIVRSGDTRDRERRDALVGGLLGEDAAKHEPRKRMFAAGKIGPKRKCKCITLKTWNVGLGGRRLYETTEQDSGASPWRAA